MAAKLNEQAYLHAQNLIKELNYVIDRRDDWSEHRPSSVTEDRFIQARGWDEYRNWYLAIDDQQEAEVKSRYKFPYGDFEKVHRCGLISAESRAGQYKHHDVETAVRHLLGMLDEQS